MCKFSSNTSGERSESGQFDYIYTKKLLESHDLQSLSPLAHDRLVHSANEAVCGLLSPAIIGIITTKLLKSKSSETTKTPTSTIIKMLSVDLFSMNSCAEMSGVSSLSHRHVPTQHGAADKHKQTHVSVHRRAHLRRTPHGLHFTASVLLQCVLSRGWSFVCCLGEKSEGERDRWRRSEENEEVFGPQLVRAIVSMTCSSLLLSLCLLACSSRSKADKISSLYLTM